MVFPSCHPSRPTSNSKECPTTHSAYELHSKSWTLIQTFVGHSRNILNTSRKSFKRSALHAQPKYFGGLPCKI